MAETLIGLYQTEVSRRRGPWRDLDAVEFASREWIDGFNLHRLREPIADVSPAEWEQAYYR